MRVRGKRRSNYFKIGRRGRRGRVAYDGRWGHVISKPNDGDNGSSRSKEGPGLSGDDSNVNCNYRADEAGTVSAVDPNYGDRIRNTLATQGTSSVDRYPPPLNNAQEHGVIEREEVLRSEEQPPGLSRSIGGRNGSVGVTSRASEHPVPIRDCAGCDSEGVRDVEMRDSDEVLESLADDGDILFADENLSEGARVSVLDGETTDVRCEARNRGAIMPVATDEGNTDGVEGEGRTWRHGEILTGFRKISKWQNLLCVLLATGSVRLSVQHFDVFRNMLNTLLELRFPDEEKLPSYSTIERTLLPNLRAWGLVKSETRTALLDLSKSGVRQVGSGCQQSESYRLVNPSAWTEMDVSCPETWHILRSAAGRAKNREDSTCAFECIEWTPMLRNREAVLNTLSTFMFPSTDEYTRSGVVQVDGQEHSTVPNKMKYTVAPRQNPPFPDTLMSALRSNGNGNGNVTSLTLEPMKSFLVLPCTNLSELSDAPRSLVMSGDVPALGRACTNLWSPGDICTSLRVPQELRYMLVLVHHQARPGRFDRRLELVCIPYQVSEADDICKLMWRACRKVTVSDFRVYSQSHEAPHRTIPYHVLPSYGRLKDGTPYFIDRILLYSDGFSQYAFKQGSAGGVYSISLNYPAYLRRTRANVRVLALTPPGVSKKEGLRAIIPDLVKCCTTGSLMRNADGEDMMVFIDVVGYVCDYNEVGHVLDVVGQNGSAPCHLCSFLRFTGPETSASRYGNTTEVHSADGCYARFAARAKALRESNITDDTLVSLGLNPNNQAAEKDSPLLELHYALMEAMSTHTLPRTEDDLPVLNPYFDPYRSVFVAPDHLLAGIAINELTHAFKALPNARRRKQADHLICHMLRMNGLLQQSKVFNFNTSTLYTTSISGTFCILLVAAPVLKEIVDDLITPGEVVVEDHNFLRTVTANICLFRMLVGLTYWYPQVNVDDPHAVSDFNRNDGFARISSLQELCVQYMSKCNAICRRSAIARKELDKPNLHRLLELYMHSIAAMGHVRHFAELVFECAHQPLKRAMARSNFKKYHLQGMKHSIADDWKNRLSAAFKGTHGLPDMVSSGKSLVNILFGRQQDVKQCIEEQPELEHVLTELLSNQLLKKVVGTEPAHFEGRPSAIKWILSEPHDGPSHLSTLHQVMQDFIVDSHALVPSLYKKARRFKVWGTWESEVRSHARSHDTLSMGLAVQCLVVDEYPVLVHHFSPSIDTEVSKTRLAYFAIEELFSAGGDVTYAAVRKCTFTNTGLLHVEPNRPLQLLELTDAVRRIGIVHSFHTDPRLHCMRSDSNDIVCSASLLEGHLFHYYNRENGYPPRMA